MASRSRDPRLDRAVLAAWMAAAFGLSAVADLRALAAALALACALLRLRALGRVLRSVVPVTALLSVASWFGLWVVQGRAPPLEPFTALLLRAALISLLTFSVLDRVDLFRALAPWPTLTRLLAVTLGQIHALRLLATESLLGLRSRLPRRPGPLDVVRGAGGITGALFTLSARNARDVSDAMRSRGF